MGGYLSSSELEVISKALDPRAFGVSREDIPELFLKEIKKTRHGNLLSFGLIYLVNQNLINRDIYEKIVRKYIDKRDSLYFKEQEFFEKFYFYYMMETTVPFGLDYVFNHLNIDGDINLVHASLIAFNYFDNTTIRRHLVNKREKNYLYKLYILMGHRLDQEYLSRLYNSYQKYIQTLGKSVYFEADIILKNKIIKTHKADLIITGKEFKIADLEFSTIRKNIEVLYKSLLKKSSFDVRIDTGMSISTDYRIDENEEIRRTDDLIESIQRELDQSSDKKYKKQLSNYIQDLEQQREYLLENIKLEQEERQSEEYSRQFAQRAYHIGQEQERQSSRSLDRSRSLARRIPDEVELQPPPLVPSQSYQRFRESRLLETIPSRRVSPLNLGFSFQGESPPLVPIGSSRRVSDRDESKVSKFSERGIKPDISDDMATPLGETFSQASFSPEPHTDFQTVVQQQSSQSNESSGQTYATDAQGNLTGVFGKTPSTRQNLFSTLTSKSPTPLRSSTSPNLNLIQSRRTSALNR